MRLKAMEVFVPGAFPQHTYVERLGRSLEETLMDALSTPGLVISLSGPSKSGKTVLVERVVGRDSLITISGASVREPDEVWDRALDWMDTPTSDSRSEVSRRGEARSSGTNFGVNLGVLQAGTSISQGDDTASETAVEAIRERRGLAQVVKEIANSEFVILLDDFHYMERRVQVEVAKGLKEAVRLGVKIVTAAVTHRGDDVVRANPELRGRVQSVDLSYWTRPELQKIAELGFAALKATPDTPAVEMFADESAGSPQLMQSLCLQTCFVMGLREESPELVKISVPDKKSNAILQQTSAMTNFRSLVEVLDAGPRTRGTERKMYDFRDGTRGDVYRVVLKAIADDPPMLSFPYEELLARTARVCKAEPPVGSSVVGTCVHMAKLALEKFPKDRAIDWDEQKQVLDVPDPYLLFYLRWSDHLREQ